MGNVCSGADDQLTKGAFHFARLKVRKQAAMLVKRFNKFRKLLPLAEAKLAEQLQLMAATSADQRPALVCSMREALQAHVQGDSAVLWTASLSMASP
jgi:hypothetical protein